MEVAPVFQPTRSKYLVITADYLIPLALSGLVIGATWFALTAPFFRIQTISCQLDYQPCTDASMLAELEKFKGHNIFTLVESTVSRRFTLGDFTIREAEVTRELPDKLHVSFQSVYPVTALKLKDVETWVTLDENLRVIGTRNTDPNVATVIVPGPLTVTVGKALEGEELRQAVLLSHRLAEELVTVKTLTVVDEDTIELALPGGLRALFTPKKDELTQLRALQAVLADATITKGIHVIDVRFSQPVLR